MIVAGSIDSPEQISAVRDGGAAGFTIGTSALNGRFAAESLHLDARFKAIMASTQAVQTRAVPEN